MAEHPRLDGTDGFRDLATRDPGPGRMNEPTIAALSYVLVEQQVIEGFRGPVVLGRDTRQSGPWLLDAAKAGVQYAAEQNPEVTGIINVGEAPTPLIQWVAQNVGAVACIALTASHNPEEYNGWKGMPGAKKPTSDQSRLINSRYWAYTDSGFAVPIDRFRGHSAEDGDFYKQIYANAVVRDIEEEFGERPLADTLFVVDGAHGAGRSFTPWILKELGAAVEQFACDDGLINDGCGAAHLEGVERFLQRHWEIRSDPRFVGAVANDGDADRLMGVGVINGPDGPKMVHVDGNHIMRALAEDQPGVVGTEYTNSALRRDLAARGIDFEECPNGDSHVTAALERRIQEGHEGWTRGGEFTGHLVDMRWLSSGDGVRMAAWLAAYAAVNGKTFGDLWRELPLWEQRMVNVHVADRDTRLGLTEDRAFVELLAEVREAAGDDERYIVRPSGTEPYVRVWGEARLGAAVLKVSLDRLTHAVHAFANGDGR